LSVFFARIPSSSYESESEEGEGEIEGGMVMELEWKPSEDDWNETTTREFR